MKVIFISLCFILIFSSSHANCFEYSDSLTNKCDTIQAQYPGGETQFLKFLASTAYPIDAKLKDIEGSVFVGFTVKHNGEIKDVHIHKGEEEMLNKAVLDHIKNMKKWIPAECDGEKISTFFIVPVKFRLSGHSKKRRKKK